MKIIYTFISAMLFLTNTTWAQSGVTPKKVQRAPAQAATVPAQSGTRVDMTNPKKYELIRGFIIRKEDNRVFSVVGPGVEVELPRPHFAVNFSKYPDFSKNQEQARALVMDTSMRYIDEYERMYLEQNDYPKKFSPFSTTREYVRLGILEAPAGVFKPQVFPPPKLTDILDETVIIFERSLTPEIYRETVELRRLIQAQKQEIDRLSAQIGSKKSQ